ncbi:MAG: hypothetical protein Q9195_003717 [Heterodermia aff. obscurata]
MSTPLARIRSQHVHSILPPHVPQRIASTIRKFNSVQRRRANAPTSVRSHDEFNSLLLLSASSRRPLLTFWTASWCPTCRVVKPLVREAVESGVGEGQGGVGFAEVEFDAPGMGNLGMKYFVRENLQRNINSMPSLLSFSRQEAQLKTMITSVDEMKDKEFLRIMTNKRMHAHILYEDEVILKLPVRSLLLVSELKKRIGAKTQLSPSEISLEYNGKTLNDSLKLDHCGVSEDTPKLKLTVINRSCDVVKEQAYWSPYEAVGDSKSPLVQQSPQGALGGQDKGFYSSTNCHDGSHDVTPIDLRTYYPTPGASSHDAGETESTGDKVPERLTNSIALGLRLHSAHMLSLALAEYQGANQALLSHYEEYEALVRVSMAEDRLKEEMHRMSTTLQAETVNQEIGAMKKY